MINGEMINGAMINGSGADVVHGVLESTLSRSTLDGYGYLSSQNGVSAELQPTTLSGFGGGIGAGDIPKTTISATGSADVWGGLDKTLNRSTLSASGTVDVVGSMAGSVSRTTMEGLGGAVLAVTLKRLTCAGTGTTDVLGRLSVTLSRTTGSASGVVDIVGSLIADLPRTTMLYGVLSATLKRSTLSASGSIDEAVTAIAYAMNLRAGGMVPYSNYDFDFIVRHQGKTYGLNSVGAYLLEGDDDNGTYIDSFIELPTTDFGSSHQKRCDSVYIGGRTPGSIGVTATVDEGTSATATAASAGRNKRAKLPKGLRGVSWGFRFENSNGANMDIDYIEVLPGISKRKV